jgi:monoamine oxidase
VSGSATAQEGRHGRQPPWETNPARAGSNRAILTDYSGAERGATLNLPAPQTQAGLFLGDLDIVYPGAAAAATRTNGQPVVHLEHWPWNPLTLCSYTCYLPGQFTTIAGIESQPVNNLYFKRETSCRPLCRPQPTRSR